MNNSDVILEFQKSIDNMVRFGKEMETLDARFGRLDQRIDVMRSSLSSLSSQVSRGAGSNLRQQLERVAKALDKKMSRSVGKEIDKVVKDINGVEIVPSLKLKSHLINQINRINNELINKIREQVDVQVNSILQEINEVTNRPEPLNRGTLNFNAGGDLGGKGDNGDGNNGGGSGSGSGSGDDTRRKRDDDSDSRTTSSVGNDKGGGFTEAIINSIRQTLSGKILDVPMMMMPAAIETFKNIQTEQIKMTQNLMLKKEYHEDANGNKMASPNFGKVENTITELQNFVRQQSQFYGIDYSKLYQVGSIGSRSLTEPVEMKKFVQLTAQLQSVDRSSDPIKIANGLESIKDQFGLEMADMQASVAEPLAMVSSLTNVSIDKLLGSIKPSDPTTNNTNVDPKTAIVLAGTSIKAPALKGANIGGFYNSILNGLQSDKTLGQLSKPGKDPFYGNDATDVAEKIQSPESTAKLKELGLGSMLDPTGAKMIKPVNEILQAVAEKLSGADNKTKGNAYDTMFGTYQSSKGAATMHEIMKSFEEVSEATKAFGKNQYDSMIKKSLDNPLVNANRAKESFMISLDAIVQELTPSINKVSYALINMADNVAKNARLFVGLGEIISNVLLGMMMMRGIKWGAEKLGVNVPREVATQKSRTGFLDGVKSLSLEGLVGDDIKNMKRKDVAGLQKDPLLDGYVRDLHGMTQNQSDNFKRYLGDKKIDVKNIETLFTAMEESRNYTPRDELTGDAKLNRQQQYNNRLSTRPELASVINPDFLNTMRGNTVNEGAYQDSRRNVEFADVSDRMTKMNQGEFQGFEDHLIQRQRNGLPAINDITSLSSALGDYEEHQRQADTAARQASPTFGNLSNAVRGMNSEMSRTEKLRSGFKNFLKDIPDLARGAVSSVGNLAKGITKLGLQMAAAFLLGTAGKAIAEGAILSNDERQLAEADGRNKDEKGLANTLNYVEGGLGNPKVYGNALRLFGGSIVNGISSFFGAPTDDIGYFKTISNLDDMKSHYKFNGSNEEFAKWIQSEDGLNMTTEEGVAKWAEETGRNEETKALRQKAANKQYADAQLKKSEEKELERIAKETYEKKQKDAIKSPISDVNVVKTRISDNMSEIKDVNTVTTLRNLMGGMKTDSEDYIAMRQQQVRSLRGVLDDELALIDKLISNAQAIMDKSDPDTKEYAEAKNAKEVNIANRKELVDEVEPDILQEEYDLPEEVFRKRLGKSNKAFQTIDLLSQAKELAATYKMDTSSQAYLDAMKQIAVNKVSSMKSELENMKNIQAQGDQSEELTTAILQQQNTIDSEQAKVKEYNLASIGIGRQKISENSSDRENELLALKLRAGNPDDSSSILRNKRIANAKSEVSEIAQVINSLKAKLPNAGADEAVKINQEIRELNKQSLTTQLGILDEMKASAGTFNMPDGVTAMSRYQYLTRGNTHNTTTIGQGEVTVNITLPNITNGMTTSQMQQVGKAVGQGLSTGRLGGLRTQMAGNPNHRS